MSQPLVSIIIPVFNVQEFVVLCIRSLLEQTYPNLEFIIVDDASPDDSLKRIRRALQGYPDRINQVRFVVHEQNRGLPAARNTGLEMACGDYIFHCDADDWMDRNMIADMVRSALKHCSEIVYTDWYLTFGKNERYMVQPAYDSPEDCIRAMLEGAMRFNVWNKLVKSTSYQCNQIRFPEGRAMGEDMTMIKLFCHATVVSYLPKAYYHYQQLNPNAYTKQISAQKLLQIRLNTDSTIDYLESFFGDKRFLNELNYFKLNIKLPFLISTDKKMYDLWRTWYPEANIYIGKNPAFSTHRRLIQYAAQKKQDWLLLLYNYIIVRIVYGVIYR